MLQGLAPPLVKNAFQIPNVPDSDAEPFHIPVEAWAQGEMLERCVMATYGADPSNFFKLQQKTSVNELFGIGNHPFDARNR